MYIFIGLSIFYQMYYEKNDKERKSRHCNLHSGYQKSPIRSGRKKRNLQRSDAIREINHLLTFSIKKSSGNHAMHQLVKLSKPARRKSSQCLHSSETQKCAAASRSSWLAHYSSSKITNSY